MPGLAFPRTDVSRAPCTGFPGEMALSAEQIQAIADAVASWRLQEVSCSAFDFTQAVC